MEAIATKQRTESSYRMAGLLTQKDPLGVSTMSGSVTSNQPTQAAFLPANPSSAQTSIRSSNLPAQTVADVKTALFSRVGRRYGTAPPPRTPDGKNPIGRDGKRMLCRGCGSDSHFIARCDRQDKAKLVAFAAELLGDDVISLSMEDVLDTIQELPDDLWQVCFSKIDKDNVGSENEAPKQVMFATDVDVVLDELVPKEVMMTKLVDSAAVHEFIGEKSMTSMDSTTVLELQEPVTQFQRSRDDLELLYYPRSDSFCRRPTPRTKGLTRIIPSSTFVSSNASLNTKQTWFEGIMLDNGASGTPSGLLAYLRYCNFIGIEPTLRHSNRRFVGRGQGVVPSLGVATVRMPLGTSHFIDFETDVVAQDVPLMFGLDQHRKHHCSSDEYHNTFTHHPSGVSVPLVYKKVHLYVEWPVSQVLFTRSELRKLHERFGHPTSKALIALSLLKRVRPEQFGEDTKKTLQDLVSRCKACQTFAQKPYVFKVSMPVDDIVFNHEIEVDLFWIEGQAALHIIDRGTRYSVAKFLESQTAEYLWNIII